MLLPVLWASAELCQMQRSIPLLQGDLILRDRNITVLPDIYTNAGGVTVSFYEWSAAQSALHGICP